jgi:hypothetical protein
MRMRLGERVLAANKWLPRLYTCKTMVDLSEHDDTSLKTNGESARNLAVPKLQQYGNIYQQ